MGQLIQLFGVRLDAIQQQGRIPPTEFLIFAFGENDTSKGTFTLTEQDCDRIIAERAEQNNGEIMIDYDHLGAEQPLIAGQAKAAGWCKLEKRADGLWAVNVRWTPAAQQMLAHAEYRFFSPAFSADKKTKAIKMLGNIALVNQPAMKKIQPLVAASIHKEKAMHKFGAMLSKYMKDASISPNTLAEKSGIALDRVQKLMGGEEPTQEEMSKCHEHMKFSDADLKECSTNSKDDDKTDGDGETDDKEPPKKVVGKEGAKDPNDETETEEEEEEEEEGEKDEKMSHLLVELTGTKDHNKQAGILAGWRQAHMKVETLSKKFEALEKRSEDARRAELIERGRREGKLSNPLVRHYASKSNDEFEAFINVAPVIFSREDLHVPERTSENVVLTREENLVAQITGKSAVELAKFVQRREQAKQPWTNDGETVDQDILNSYLNAK